MVIDNNEIAIFDTVDKNFKDEWLQNIEKRLNGLYPKYLIVQHMEPDHAANIDEFIKKYPKTIVVSSQKAF
jgi:flavorubredoxin